MPTGPSEHWIPAHAGMTPANWASFGVRKLQCSQSLPRIPLRLTHVLPTRPILRASPHRSEVANEQLARRDRVAGASAPARPEHRVPRKSNPASGPGSVAWPVPAARGLARGRSFPRVIGKGSACAGEVAPDTDVPSPKPRSRGEAPASTKRGIPAPGTEPRRAALRGGAADDKSIRWIDLSREGHESCARMAPGSRTTG